MEIVLAVGIAIIVGAVLAGIMCIAYMAANKS
jgi:hypothetical protein